MSGDYNFIPDFPRWVWILILIIFGIGVLTVAGCGIGGIIWICKHLFWR